MNSPKLWTQNFIYYLKETHPELYMTIIYILQNCYTVISGIIIICLLYFIGFCCITNDEKNRLYEETGVIFYVVIFSVGVSIALLLTIIYKIVKLATISIIDFIIQMYNIINKFVSALQQYTHNINEINASV